jgi:prepilin peptidase CpaA
MLTYLPPILQALLVLVVATAGIYDLRFRRIPNWLVLVGLVLGFALNAYLAGWAGLKTAGMGLGLAFLVYFPLYLLRAMGAGDVKLMGAVGAIVGPGNWLAVFVITAIIGGVVALFVLLFAGRVQKTFWNLGWILNEVIHLRAPYHSSEELDVRSPRAMRLPHGAVIALGAVVFLTARAIWGGKVG